ncbi:hypothetical protein, conserved [Plasmodium gonderi]|uniref:Uncharacterized protein n=1 Tax=Plasmodium gonderi TaxID=77519 RepID=A0A1Y1JG93_PLAGO|nr:hypothetical protein, conserved [Plasmodium gonderi]GAW81539.1 hypothetical protein, conserved [Plasmodium gonderi]
MVHKIDSFLHICKAEKETQVKKDVIKRLVPTKRKFTKGVTIKYVLHNCKTKSNLIKKKWNINFILNKTKSKRKKRKKRENDAKNMSDKIIVQNSDITEEHKIGISSEKGSSNFVSQKSFDMKNFGSYKKLLNKIVQNVKRGQNSTIINTGVDTQKREKNIFFYGYLYRTYLRDKENVEKDTDMIKYFTNELDKETTSEGEIKKKKESHEGFISSCCNGKRIRENYTQNRNLEECLRKKKGLIFDIYDRIVNMNSEAHRKISISSWVYKNCKIIDMLKKKSPADKTSRDGKNRRDRKGNEKNPFCHRCFIKKSFDRLCFGYPHCCKELPINKVIKNGEILENSLKRIIKKCIKIVERRKKKIINVCFVFKYKIRMDRQDICIYLVNFPLCNIQKNKIFNNSNNEKSLLFLFNKKILKSVRNVNDYSSFIFPFNNAKGCQRVHNLKKKMINFVSQEGGLPRLQHNVEVTRESANYMKLSNTKEERESIPTPTKPVQEEDNISPNACKNEETKKRGGIVLIRKYNKKDIIFHIHLFELLIRLIFENSKTYFTFFITDLTCNYELYKNVYYLNLSKIVNIRMNIKKTRHKIGNGKTEMDDSTRRTIHTLMKQNDECKNIINEKDKVILILQNEVREKNSTMSQLENQVLKYKNDQSDMLKTVENLKNKISKKETNKKENNVDEQLVKNTNYIKKLYNENNLLKEKIKKLNELTKKGGTSSNSVGKLPDSKESDKTCIPANSEATKEEEKNEKLNFFKKAFLDTEQKLYTADIVINTQKEIISKIKNEKNSYFEQVERNKIIFKREVEKSLDFMHSICEDIKTKKEKICLTNRINKLHDCINDFLSKFEKDS